MDCILWVGKLLRASGPHSLLLGDQGGRGNGGPFVDRCLDNVPSGLEGVAKNTGQL